MSLTLEQVQLNLIELAALSERNGSITSLSPNYSNTRIVNKKSLEGSVSSSVRWVFEGLIFEDTGDASRKRVFENLESSLISLIDRAEEDLKNYEVATQHLISQEDNFEFDTSFLIHFSRTFRPLLHLLRSERAVILNRLFLEIFSPKLTVVYLKERLVPFYVQRSFIQFELLTRNKIPWKELADMACDRDFNEEEGGIIYLWLKNMMMVPGKAWMTENQIDSWKAKVVHHLAKLLPLIHARIEDSNRGSTVVCFNDFIIYLKHFELNFALDRTKVKICQNDVTIDSEVVISDTITQIAERYDEGQRHLQYIPLRRVLNNSCLYAVYENIEPLPAREHPERLFVLSQLVDSFLRDKLFLERCDSSPLVITDLGFNHENTLTTKVPLKVVPLDLKALDIFVIASTNSGDLYKRVFANISVDTKMGRILRALRINCIQKIAYPGNKLSALKNIFQIDDEYFKKFIKPLKKYVREGFTGTIRALEEDKSISIKTSSPEFKLFWNTFAWTISPGITNTQSSREDIKRAYRDFLKNIKEVKVVQREMIYSHLERSEVWKELGAIKI